MKYAFSRLKLLLVASGIVFVALILVVFRLFGTTNPEGTISQVTGSPQSEKQYTGLVVDFGNGKLTSYESIEIKEGETAYSLLVKKMNETGSSVTTKTYDFGIMVESINGISGNANFFWQYSVNGQMGQVAADNYTLKNKDKVEWKYTSTSN